MATYALRMTSARQARADAERADAERVEFKSRMAYVNRCAEQLAVQLYNALQPYVMRACKFKCAGTMISFIRPDEKGWLPEYPVCFSLPQNDNDSRKFDPTIPVFVNARGEMFPQESDGDLPVLEGDDKRIPISLCFIGYKADGLTLRQSHNNLTKRGIKSVLVHLYEMLNAEYQTAVYLNYIERGCFQVSIAWEPYRFEEIMTRKANRHEGMETRGWKCAICLY